MESAAVGGLWGVGGVRIVLGWRLYDPMRDGETQHGA